MSPKPVIYLDTDISLGTPGAEIDDGAALILLLGSPQIEVAGIGSVFGNTAIENVNQNLARMLNYIGKETIPFGCGVEKPLEGSLDWFAEWQAGYGRTRSFKYNKPKTSAAQLLIDLIYQYPNQLTIIAIGPLTNLAAALKQAPDIAKKVKSVIAMGGSFDSQPKEPEFNIHCDPKAAQIVFQAGWPLTLLGLEVTRQVHFSREDFTTLQNTHPAVHLLQEQAAGWIGRVEAMGWEKGGCSLHDAVAAVYMIHPEIFETRPVKIEVSIGREWPDGTTLIQPAMDSDEHTVRIVTEVNAPKCKDLIWSAITQLSSSCSNQKGEGK